MARKLTPEVGWVGGLKVLTVSTSGRYFRLDALTRSTVSTELGESPSSPPRPRLDALTRSAVVTRTDGRELRRMTIYLPADLAKRLAVRCAELDADLSAVIAEAVAKHLDA